MIIMEFKSLIAMATLGGLIVLSMFWINAGLFTKVEVQTMETGPFSFAYLNHTGDYSTLYTKIDRVYYDLLDRGIDSQVGIGVFYDHVKDNISIYDQKSQGGYIISERDVEKVKAMGEFKIKTLEKKRRVIAEYPLKSQMSIKAGAVKVYPKITQFMWDKGFEEGIAIEIYDTKNKKIVYMVEIENYN